MPSAHICWGRQNACFANKLKGQFPVFDLPEKNLPAFVHVVQVILPAQSESYLHTPKLLTLGPKICLNIYLHRKKIACIRAGGKSNTGSFYVTEWTVSM